MNIKPGVNENLDPCTCGATTATLHKVNDHLVLQCECGRLVGPHCSVEALCAGWKDSEKPTKKKAKKIDGTTPDVLRQNFFLFDVIDKLRIEAGIRTKAQLASLIGIGESYYYKLIRGEKPLNREHITALANALGITVSELYRRAGL